MRCHFCTVSVASLVSSLQFLIAPVQFLMQAIKNWSRERPGNEATHSYSDAYFSLLDHIKSNKLRYSSGMKTQNTRYC